jgi:hypothetical protein
MYSFSSHFQMLFNPFENRFFRHKKLILNHLKQKGKGKGHFGEKAFFK